MTSPITGGQVKEVSTIEDMEFRGEHFKVPVRYYVCIDTGEEFTTTEQDGEWTASLYDQYRAKHHIPSPQQIRDIRAQYGLNLSQMTSVLGFGKNQYSNYEQGQVPNLSNGRLISLIIDPVIMRRCIEMSSLDETEKKDLAGRIIERTCGVL